MINSHGGVPVPKPVGNSTRRNKRRAYNMERQGAKNYSAVGIPAQRVVMSGALKGVGLDGDVNVGNTVIGWLEEDKNYTPLQTATGRYLRFDLNWLTKIKAEGELHGKPGLVVMQPKGYDDAVVVMWRSQFRPLMGRAYKALTGEDSGIDYREPSGGGDQRVGSPIRSGYAGSVGPELIQDPLESRC